MNRGGRPGGAFRDHYGKQIPDGRLQCLQCDALIRNRADRLKTHLKTCIQSASQSTLEESVRDSQNTHPVPDVSTFEEDGSLLPLSRTDHPVSHTPTAMHEDSSDTEVELPQKRAAPSPTTASQGKIARGQLSLSNYFVRTSGSERRKLQLKWAKAFYKVSKFGNVFFDIFTLTNYPYSIV